jgi:hypothetical protein
MQATKIDIFIIIGLFVLVFSLMINGCNSGDTVSAGDMYQKCAEVNEDNPEECDQSFTVYQ